MEIQVLNGDIIQSGIYPSELERKCLIKQQVLLDLQPNKIGWLYVPPWNLDRTTHDVVGLGRSLA